MFNNMYDIITFGSAAHDIFLKSKSFKIVEGQKDFVTGQGICLPYGSKVDVEDIVFSSGGGGTNTAAAFAKQGFKTAFCGAVGDDVMGRELLRELSELRVDTRFITIKKEKHTNQSVIMSTLGDERTILVYRGASELMNDDDIPFKKLKAKWFYIAPLSGGSCNFFEMIVNFAVDNNIKVAINPSKQQLAMPARILENILSKADILLLNREEASFLTDISFSEDEKIFKRLDEICPGIAVMTKGGEGVTVSDGKYLYFGKPYPGRKIADTTGAGDSFCAGFLSDYIRTNGNIEAAIQFGLANSASNLAEVGAKIGLLDKNSQFDRIPVTKQEILKDNPTQKKTDKTNETA